MNIWNKFFVGLFQLMMYFLNKFAGRRRQEISRSADLEFYDLLEARTVLRIIYFVYPLISHPDHTSIKWSPHHHNTPCLGSLYQNWDWRRYLLTRLQYKVTRLWVVLMKVLMIIHSGFLSWGWTMDDIKGNHHQSNWFTLTASNREIKAYTLDYSCENVLLEIWAWIPSRM